MGATRRDRDRLAQRFLEAQGFSPGIIDGWWGSKSQGAFERWEASLEPARPAGRFRQVFRRSPNQGGFFRPEAVLFHHSAGTWAGDQSWILNPASRVSYHVLINLDGERVEFVKPDARAWHAGPSRFLGRSGCNGFCLGVSFTGNTNTGEFRGRKKLLTAEEIASAVEYLRPLVELHRIPFKAMTHHRIVSPGRKTDLRPETWEQLRAELERAFA